MPFTFTHSPVEGIWISISDLAAKMIGLSESYVFELLAKGELPRLKIGRSTLIEVAELKRWIERQKAA